MLSRLTHSACLTQSDGPANIDRFSEAGRGFRSRSNERVSKFIRKNRESQLGPEARVIDDGRYRLRWRLGTLHSILIHSETTVYSDRPSIHYPAPFLMRLSTKSHFFCIVQMIQHWHYWEIAFSISINIFFSFFCYKKHLKWGGTRGNEESFSDYTVLYDTFMQERDGGGGGLSD